MSREDDYASIIQIGDILVSGEIIEEFFACDYEKCRGKCCIVGDSGAPLEEDELEGLEEGYPKYSPLMRTQGMDAVARKGFFEVDIEGDLVTPLVEGSEECAFCHFEGGSCLCSIERVGLVKPRSCSLYPIRVTRLTGGGQALNLHRWDICADAYAKGRREGTRVYQFLKGPLVAVYGEEFYSMLSAAAENLLSRP